jgi:hypothetical protein
MKLDDQGSSLGLAGSSIDARLPGRDVVRKAYNEAIREIEAARGTQQFENEFHRCIADAVFDGCYSALEHFTAWVEQRGPADKATPRELRALRREIGGQNAVAPRLHVVSAPMGTGKTTFTTAFIMAMVRLADSYPSMPYGCLFLTDQIVKADGMYIELSRFLPNNVAIWTTNHDVDCLSPTKVNPAATFHKDDLQHFPVAIVTHAFFKSEGAEKARLVERSGERIFRALTVVDEQMQDVIVHDTSLVAVGQVIELMHEQHDTELLPHIDTLQAFISSKVAKGSKIEKPRDDRASWQVATQLEWFTTDEATRYAMANRDRRPEIDAVFGFAKAMVRDYAFIASGPTGPRFVGYEPQHSIVPGMVLLDATADLDGVTQLCPWRSHVDVPRGRFDKLTIVHVEQCHTDRLTKYLGQLENRTVYVAWMKQLIRDHMIAGQRGLIVCKKLLIDDRNVPDWPPDDSRFTQPQTYTRGYGWDVDGRHVSLTYWGGPGVGSNAWRDADVVFLLDEYFLPHRTTIGSTQGLLLAPTSSGPIASMTALNTDSEEVTTIREGHLLRWTKQLAMRGKARFFDERGICGEQKLVVTGDFERLLLHRETLFPGARLLVVRDKNRDLSKYGKRLGMLEVLSDPDLPETVQARAVAQALGKTKWGDISGDCINEISRRMLRSLGWTYVNLKGASGALFRRLSATEEHPPTGQLAANSEQPTSEAQSTDTELRLARMRLLELLKITQKKLTYIVTKSADRWDF